MKGEHVSTRIIALVVPPVPKPASHIQMTTYHVKAHVDVLA